MNLKSVEELKKESYRLNELLQEQGADIKLSAVREMVSKLAGFTSFNAAVNSLSQAGSAAHILVKAEKAVLVVRNNMVERPHDQTPAGIQETVASLKKEAADTFHREDVAVHLVAADKDPKWITPLEESVYRTIVVAEVMTNGPMPDYDSLAELGHDTIYGEASGIWEAVRTEKIETVEELMYQCGRQGSDEEFFLGEDSEDHDNVIKIRENS